MVSHIVDFPLIGNNFGTPELRGVWSEQNRLKQQVQVEVALEQAMLRAPAYFLGTAESHPWLIQLYEAMGFEKASKKDLGKGHITVYMKKPLIHSPPVKRGGSEDIGELTMKKGLIALPS